MKKFLSIFLSIFLVCGLVGCSGEENESNKKEDITANIITITQSIVKENLKCPSTANFPWSFDEYNIKETNSKNNNMIIYNVSGHVDAENSFGAKLRNNFVIKIECTQDLSKYKVLDVSIQ
ncbi:hypothetical protein G8T71_07020 [Clostridium botulinum C/D]|uniref:hypothetical protein n=1 Tax=Clostridium botulinum TaxID=1491 RepID=UPI001E4A130D|nr:hypothetical protein [Clostridium botulinum]MCD3211105.1 hypothetical protein [Clostridium botulinum C/D]